MSSDTVNSIADGGITEEALRFLFPDIDKMKCGWWSDHFYECADCARTNTVQQRMLVGLYREPEGSGEYAGTFTLQGYIGDDVIFAKTVLERSP